MSLALALIGPMCYSDVNHSEAVVNHHGTVLSFSSYTGCAGWVPATAVLTTVLTAMTGADNYSRESLFSAPVSSLAVL